MRKLKTSFMKSLAFILITIIVISSCTSKPVKVESVDTVLTLVAKVRAGNMEQYCELLKEQLEQIGINLQIEVLSWSEYVTEIITTHNYDLISVSLYGSGDGAIDIADVVEMYSSDSPMNFFGYNTSIDYNATLGTGINQWFIDQGKRIIPAYSEERIQHYWDWEQYLMDDLLLCMPLFSYKNYIAHWANLQGYNYSEGFVQSWGKMAWDGIHENQLMDKELVISSFSDGSSLNPLFQNDSLSSIINRFIMDPLVWYDADKTVWPHLAKSWGAINDTHIRIQLRKGIKWQPDPENLFLNETLTAEDVYFTFYSWKELSDEQLMYNWLEKMEIVDNYTIDFYIDGSIATPENEPYPPYLVQLNSPILPEHYLNQTQLIDGKTPDMNHSSWKHFSNHSFGTGILQLESYQPNSESLLSLNNDCWKLNETLLTDPELEWERRFGNQWVLEDLRIKVLNPGQTGFGLFEDGHIDLVNINTEKRNEYAENENFSVQNTYSLSISFFAFNLRSEREFIGNHEPCPLDPSITIGLAVRKAVAYAMNRTEMNQIVHEGEYEINHYPISRVFGIWCNPNIIKYSRDVSKARLYLLKAGLIENLTFPSYSISPKLDCHVLFLASSFVSFAVLIVALKRRKR
ncbi:MAG: hypothetical protein GF308_10425 [Candidatus Heimdallarchaeota archaeon]|nr:hypothetical protein [Candidatus Heimdallarchaeota archaeon]